jgi:hypothetical protein
VWRVRFSPAKGRRIAAKIEWYYTPEHGSWLNVAECELPVVKRQCLKGRMLVLEAAEPETDAWQRRRSHRPALTGSSQQIPRTSSSSDLIQLQMNRNQID